MGNLFDSILVARGLSDAAARQAFVSPDYDVSKHDPFMLGGMEAAVDRIVAAKNANESITIYGDYDIDGLTATSILMDAFASFDVAATPFIPNRFVEGYGMTVDAVERIASTGATLIVTVDCGSLSHEPIKRARELGVDVIVTDHHTVGDTLPPDAIAVVNPKRHDNTYPFRDLAGCGVAFKLVQALQTRLEGLPVGQEKWLLDLVALGTVCDVVTLQDENRTNVHWGLKVMAKTRRPGLRALMAVARVTPETLNARALGFGLGPRLNASGRLETAQRSLDLLLSTDNHTALQLADKLDAMNTARRAEQQRIFAEASDIAELHADDKVLVLAGKDWSHGIVGIVAAKILEKYKKPAFVIEIMDDGTAKGSARSYGDFSAVAAIRANEQHIIKGGGHTLAAGVTLQADKVDDFRTGMNAFYKASVSKPQLELLDPSEDLRLDVLHGCDEDFVRQLDLLEPYGHGNPAPIVKLCGISVGQVRLMGDQSQHIKLHLIDNNGQTISLVAFGVAEQYKDVQPGDRIDVWFEPTINEWKGRRSVEGRLLKLTRDA